MERLPVNEPGHMDRLYLWRTGKPSRRAHIEDHTTGRTHCQAENCGGGKPFDGKGTEVPAGRRICRNCLDLAGRDRADYREPSLAVLMGERIAEAEAELFADAAAPMPAVRTVRTKQPRPVNRSRGRKPKRSAVKHPRPFDDPLPW